MDRGYGTGGRQVLIDGKGRGVRSWVRLWIVVEVEG